MLLVSSKNAISSFNIAVQAGNIPFPQDQCIHSCILMNVVCAQTNCLTIFFFFLKVMSFLQGPLHQGAENGPVSLFQDCSSGDPSIQRHFLSGFTLEFFYNLLAVPPFPLSNAKCLILPTVEHPHTLFLDHSLTKPPASDAENLLPTALNKDT